MRWKRYVITFLATALVGLVIRKYASGVVGDLFGQDAFGLKFLGSRLLLPMLLAAVVGYLLPKGFFLWVIAVMSLHPLEEARQTGWANEWGAFGSSGIGDSELLGLIFVPLMMLALLAFVCTIASALGVGLRLLWWRYRGESVGSRLGLASDGSDPA